MRSSTQAGETPRKHMTGSIRATFVRRATGQGVAVAAALLVLLPGVAGAGAWVTPPNEGYLKIAAGFAATRTRFDFEGTKTRMEDTRYEETQGLLYTALGLTERVELNLATTLKAAELDAPEGLTSSSGAGDLFGGLKLGLFEEPYVQSIQLGIKVPTGYDDEREPPLGDGQIDLDARLLFGGSLWSLGLPAYVGLEAGYKHRVGTPGDAVFFLAEAGGDLARELGLRFKLDGTYALELPEDDESATELFALDKRVTRLDSTVYVRILEETFLEVGFVRVLSARNLTGGDGWNVGIAHRLTL